MQVNFFWNFNCRIAIYEGNAVTYFHSFYHYSLSDEILFKSIDLTKTVTI